MINPGIVKEVSVLGGGSDGAILDGASSAIKATVKDLPNSNPITAAIVDGNGDQITSFGGGVQYTEGDTDVSITGTAMMFEDTGNALVVPSATHPLPIDTTGLALAANQLPDGHNVTVDNVSIPVTGTFWQATQPVSMTALPVASVSATTADATASGDTTIVSITNSPRLYYISLSANGANSADVTAIVKIGATNKYKVSLKAGAIWARNIGAGNSFITGASGEDIVVNLSAAQTVHVSVEYADV